MGRGADPCLSHGSLYTLRHIERAGWRVGLSIGYQADRQAVLSTLHLGQSAGKRPTVI